MIPKETQPPDLTFNALTGYWEVPIKQFRLPLYNGNEVELRFFGKEFGVDQLETLSELLTVIRGRFGKPEVGEYQI